MLGTMIGARSGNAKRIAEADVVSGKEQTMSKDIIYREDAIKAIEELPNAYNGWSDAYDKTYIIGTLEEVPKADRPQGEWIEHRPPTNDYCGMVECPFCGEELVGEPTDFNYCPNCGRRLKGAENEAD